VEGHVSEQRANEATVAFVDLAGFAALTEVHGDARAVELVEEFEDFAAAALGPEDRLVKMMGDAAMFSFAAPADALAALRRIFGTCLNAPGFPLPQAGIHHGPVIERARDIFGGTANLAARVVAEARGGQVLATGPTADVARAAGVRVHDLGPRRLRNLSGEVELFAIDLVPATRASSVDPVCRMRVDHDGGPGVFLRLGGDHWFCSSSCAELFATDPDGYAGALAV
jgi:adenylate cyclase